MRAMRWWVVAFLAGVVLLASAGAFLWTHKRRAPAAAAPAFPRVRCPDADKPMPPLRAPDETTPVILWGAGKVRLFLDGQPTSSPPEAPLRFAAGEHVLRVEAPGSSTSFTFELEPFRPVMFHAEETPGAGLTLAVLGPRAPPERTPLDFTRTSATDDALLEEAGAALRLGDAMGAAAKLRAVTPKRRSGDAFLRLAAAIQPAFSEGMLSNVKGNDLPMVLDAWRTLSASEKTRSETPSLARWNLVTQKFSTLLEKFALEAPGPVQLATSRLSELSTGFVEATRQKDTLTQDETVNAAELALEQFVRALRRSRPEDCDFQSRVSASL